MDKVKLFEMPNHIRFQLYMGEIDGKIDDQNMYIKIAKPGDRCSPKLGIILRVPTYYLDEIKEGQEYNIIDIIDVEDAR
jgi:hypothetical protein